LKASLSWIEKSVLFRNEQASTTRLSSTNWLRGFADGVSVHWKERLEQLWTTVPINTISIRASATSLGENMNNHSSVCSHCYFADPWDLISISTTVLPLSWLFVSFIHHCPRKCQWTYKSLSDCFCVPFQSTPEIQSCEPHVTVRRNCCP
jgi:hypothetical protein